MLAGVPIAASSPTPAATDAVSSQERLHSFSRALDDLLVRWNRPDDHRPVEWLTSHEVGELRRGSARICDPQQPAPAEVRESRRERFDHLTGSPIEVLRAERRERPRLADQEPSKRHDLRPHDAERQPATQVVESKPAKVALPEMKGALLCSVGS